MLPLFWLLLLVFGACIILLIPIVLGREFYGRYRGARAVTCPQNHREVAVSFDAFHAAVTRLAGEPDFRLADCSRWPEHADCGRECLPEAVRSLPYAKNEVAATGKKSIYHIPVLIAAVVAWAMGAFWHSHYLFRAEWMDAVGLNRLELHQLVWRLAPHLLTAAVPLLFAYGVAWWLSWSDQKGIWRGIAVALLFWAMLAGISLAIAGLDGLSTNLLKVEFGYTFLASFAIGAIVGGLSGDFIEHKFAS